MIAIVYKISIVTLKLSALRIKEEYIRITHKFLKHSQILYRRIPCCNQPIPLKQPINCTNPKWFFPIVFGILFSNSCIFRCCQYFIVTWCLKCIAQLRCGAIPISFGCCTWQNTNNEIGWIVCFGTVMTIPESESNTNKSMLTNTQSLKSDVNTHCAKKETASSGLPM